MKYATRTLLNRPLVHTLAPKACSISTDFVRDADSGLTSVPDAEILDAAFRILAKRMAKGPVLSNPRQTQQYLQLRFADREEEVFAAFFLSKRFQVIAFEELFQGTIDGASVHPRVVVKKCLVHNAAALLITHNHPSQHASASQADEMITQRIKAAVELIDVRLVDHVIVANAGYYSFAEHGLL